MRQMPERACKDHVALAAIPGAFEPYAIRKNLRPGSTAEQARTFSDALPHGARRQIRHARLHQTLDACLAAHARRSALRGICTGLCRFCASPRSRAWLPKRDPCACGRRDAAAELPDPTPARDTHNPARPWKAAFPYRSTERHPVTWAPVFETPTAHPKEDQSTTWPTSCTRDTASAQSITHAHRSGKAPDKTWSMADPYSRRSISGQSQAPSAPYPAGIKPPSNS